MATLDGPTLAPGRPQGDWRTPPKLIGAGPARPRRSLGAYAWSLAAGLAQRDLFWWLIERNGLSAPLAGEIALQVGRSRSLEIQAELKAAGGPAAWFARAVLAGLKDGRIPRGRDAEPSERARFFFSLLAGDGGLERLEAEILAGRGYVKVLDIARDFQLSRLAIEAAEFVIYNQLDGKPDRPPSRPQRRKK